MVEANPAKPSPERLADVEEQIFDPIDEEIRAFHDWCKDFVEELSRRIEDLSRRHRDIASQKRDDIIRNKAEIRDMFRRQAVRDIEERLRNIIQTEDQRNGFLIATEADLRDSAGQFSLAKIMDGLSESEIAVKNRCDKLALSQNGVNLLDEITRKVAHTLSEIDQILSQFGEGYDVETHTEKFRRQLKEADTRWKNLQAKFRAINPGPNLSEQFKELKSEVVQEKQYLSFGNKVYEVDMTKPGPIEKIEHSLFNFDFSASACVNGDLFLFKDHEQEKRVSVTKYQNISEKDAVVKI